MVYTAVPEPVVVLFKVWFNELPLPAAPPVTLVIVGAVQVQPRVPPPVPLLLSVMPVAVLAHIVGLLGDAVAFTFGSTVTVWFSRLVLLHVTLFSV